MISIHGYTLNYFIFALLLAVIPFGISLLAYKSKVRGSVLVVLLAVWLVLFPNIPYLFTKGRYLMGYCGSLSPWDLCGNSWMIGFFFFHSLIGVPLMYFSIQMIARKSRGHFKNTSHWFVALISLFISAVVTPVGLYGRFNSWDVFIQPRNIFVSFGEYFTTSGIMEISIWFVIYLLIYSVVHVMVGRVKEL